MCSLINLLTIEISITKPIHIIFIRAFILLKSFSSSPLLLILSTDLYTKLDFQLPFTQTLLQSLAQLLTCSFWKKSLIFYCCYSFNQQFEIFSYCFICFSFQINHFLYSLCLLSHQKNRFLNIIKQGFLFSLFYFLRSNYYCMLLKKNLSVSHGFTFYY